MAAPPTVADLQALILLLQAQVANLQAAIPAAPATGAAAVITFADTLQMLNANDLLDYSTKRGSSIYEQGCKALDNKALASGFGMTTDQMVVFVEAVSRQATAMGRNKGTKQITTFANCGETPVDLIKCYRQINEATLKIACERFCKAGELDAKSCAKQNNTMMAICLASSLTAEAQARLFTYCNKYTFDGVEYAPLLYKIIMQLATIDSVATTQTLQENLQNLGGFAATVNGDINKIHGKFDRNHLQLLARGATVDNPIGLLFDAYSVIPCHNFKEYIRRHHDDWLDGKLTRITHETLMIFATRKCDYLKTKELGEPNLPVTRRLWPCRLCSMLSRDISSLMTSSEMLSRAKARAKQREKVAIRRQRPRITLEIRPSRRRTRHGRRSLPRMETTKVRRWASTLTIGVSIIWHVHAQAV